VHGRESTPEDDNLDGNAKFSFVSTMKRLVLKASKAKKDMPK
jgi:hypothetical protein